MKTNIRTSYGYRNNGAKKNSTLYKKLIEKQKAIKVPLELLSLLL